MAQGEFTKQEARETIKALDEIMNGIPKSKAAQFIGHYNDVFLFLRAAGAAAPEEAPGPAKT